MMKVQPMDKYQILRNNEMLKENLIRIARDHKTRCTGSECEISLNLLWMTGLRSGLHFTDEETRIFL